MHSPNSVRLTKGRFIQALSCPTKLYYAADKSYANQSIEDPFLAALAEGGFQVGELAKCYFPGGIEITSLNQSEAAAETYHLLKQDNVVLFEPAIEFENCLVRVDILVKSGNRIQIHEVKAKSFDSHEGPDFLKRDGSPNQGWKKYLYDIAFQKWVVQKAFPDWSISAHLMLTDKAQRTNTSGLNQHFPIVTDERGRKRVEYENTLSTKDLEPKILTSVNVDSICSDIFSSTDHGLGVTETFSQMINRLSNACKRHELIDFKIGKHCKECEFIAFETDRDSGLKEGRSECFQRKLGLDATIFKEPTVLDLWNYRGKDKLISKGIIRLRDVTEDDISVKPADLGISPTERQWLQVEKAKLNDDTVWIDKEGLKSEMNSWVYPLHFIDFETTMVSIPFGAGRRPYEGIAFQFSHHVVESDGSVRHAGQFLNTERGHFPNYDFVRALKGELESDEGSIFKYSGHENTYLNLIVEQLESDVAPPDDKDELISFIKSITHSKGGVVKHWKGDRDMIDLLEIVKRYYFDPRTNGSNSIKYVLPAILSRSSYLQDKYSKPIYGTPDGIQSLNFQSWQWLRFDKKGMPINPYDQLPKLFSAQEERQIELLSDNDSLQNGGAALMAYARMQFERMTDYEHHELSRALLKYCELDTLAMVMIYEAWYDDLNESTRP